mgnify:CR=1 FL=1
MFGGEIVNREYAASKLREWIKANGLTYKQVANELGVSVSTIKSWLYCQRSISFDRAIQICDLFGKPLDELACREPKAS